MENIAMDTVPSADLWSLLPFDPRTEVKHNLAHPQADVSSVFGQLRQNQKQLTEMKSTKTQLENELQSSRAETEAPRNSVNEYEHRSNDLGKEREVQQSDTESSRQELEVAVNADKPRSTKITSKHEHSSSGSTDELSGMPSEQLQSTLESSSDIFQSKNAKLFLEICHKVTPQLCAKGNTSMIPSPCDADLQTREYSLNNHELTGGKFGAMIEGLLSAANEYLTQSESGLSLENGIEAALAEILSEITERGCTRDKKDSDDSIREIEELRWEKDQRVSSLEVKLEELENIVSQQKPDIANLKAQLLEECQGELGKLRSELANAQTEFSDALKSQASVAFQTPVFPADSIILTREEHAKLLRSSELCQVFQESNRTLRRELDAITSKEDTTERKLREENEVLKNEVKSMQQREALQELFRFQQLKEVAMELENAKKTESDKLVEYKKTVDEDLKKKDDTIGYLRQLIDRYEHLAIGGENDSSEKDAELEETLEEKLRKAETRFAELIEYKRKAGEDLKTKDETIESLRQSVNLNRQIAADRTHDLTEKNAELDRTRALIAELERKVEDSRANETRRGWFF